MALALTCEYVPSLGRGLGGLQFGGADIPEDSKAFQIPVSETRLRDIIASRHIDVATLVKQLGPDFTLKPAMASEVLYKFYLTGIQVWIDLLGRDRAYSFLRELGPRLLGHLPNAWYLARPGEIAGQLPEIEVRGCRNQLLPIDILPIGLWERYDIPTSHEDLCQLAGLFGAFSSVIRFVSYGNSSEDRPTRNTSVRPGRCFLPMDPAADSAAVTLFRSKDTKRFEGVQKWLQEKMDLEGPLPNEALSISEWELASKIVYFEPGVSVSGKNLIPAYHHVHAHAASGEGNTSLTIQFLLDDERSLFVESPHFRRALDATLDLPSTTSGPIITFSACQAAAGSAHLLANTAMDMADAGCAAVVGPRQLVLEDVAHFMASTIYEAVSRRRSPTLGLPNLFNVGIAVSFARWSLLKRAHNPSGVIYTIFGEPNAPVL